MEVTESGKITDIKYERCDAKNLARLIENSLNSSGFSKKDFAEQMGQAHRYLQSEFTGLCLVWFNHCAKMYDENKYDGRNAWACRIGKEIDELLN